MAEDFLSFEDVLRDLQMQEGELRGMVSQGKLRAFRDENTLKFRRSDVERLRTQRAAQPTDMVRPGGKPAVRPVSEEPIDLLSDDIMDYDDTADTIVGGEPAADTSETELGLADTGIEAAARPSTSTGVPTIELTPTEAATDETTVPTLELSEEAALAPDTGAETEIPTMVLGLDEYDDTQVGTEEVATEEVYIDEGDLAASAAPTSEMEAPLEGIGEAEEAPEAVGRISASSGFGTGSGEALVRREAPSALFTITSAVAAIILAIPGSIFFYCLISRQVPQWGILQSVMKFVWDQLNIPYPPGVN